MLYLSVLWRNITITNSQWSVQRLSSWATSNFLAILSDPKSFSKRSKVIDSQVPQPTSKSNCGRQPDYGDATESKKLIKMPRQQKKCNISQSKHQLSSSSSPNGQNWVEPRTKQNFLIRNKLTKPNRRDSYTIEQLNNRTDRLLHSAARNSSSGCKDQFGSTWLQLASPDSTWLHLAYPIGAQPSFSILSLLFHVSPPPPSTTASPPWS